MPNYYNGYVPDKLLVTFKTGRNKTDGGAAAITKTVVKKNYWRK